jgi:hypothetical protein
VGSNLKQINAYDEYGIPGGTGSGRGKGGVAFVANPEAIPSRCLGSIEGDGRTQEEPREEKPNNQARCDPVQIAAQTVGKKAIELGSDTTKSGIAIAAAGAIIGSVGASKGNLALALRGTIIFARGGVVAAGGSGITALGATLSAVAGSGKTAVAEFTAGVLLSKFSDSPLKSAFSEAISSGLSNIIPDIKSCK